MGATASAIASFFGSGTAAAGAGTAAAGAGTAAAGAGTAAAGAGTAAAATGTAAAATSGIAATVAEGAALAAGASLAGKLLAPDVPEIGKPTPMPDPLDVQRAKERSIIQQMARRGRSASILTGTGGGTLGG